MTAEEFFEWVRSCATKRDRAMAVRRHLYDKRSSSPLVSSGSGGDPMAYIDAAMDREREIDAEIARYDAVRQRAMQVIQAASPRAAFMLVVGEPSRVAHSPQKIFGPLRS